MQCALKDGPPPPPPQACPIPQAPDLDRDGLATALSWDFQQSGSPILMHKSFSQSTLPPIKTTSLSNMCTHSGPALSVQLSELQSSEPHQKRKTDRPCFAQNPVWTSSTSTTLASLGLVAPHELGVITSISQMVKVRIREVSQLLQSHAGRR